MLVLSRKLGEKIVIGDNVVVTLVEIGRGVVRLAIEAPREVKIMRQELLLNRGGNDANPGKKGTGDAE